MLSSGQKGQSQNKSTFSKGSRMQQIYQQYVKNNKDLMSAIKPFDVSNMTLPGQENAAQPPALYTSF